MEYVFPRKDTYDYIVSTVRSLKAIFSRKVFDRGANLEFQIGQVKTTKQLDKENVEEEEWLKWPHSQAVIELVLEKADESERAVKVREDIVKHNIVATNLSGRAVSVDDIVLCFRFIAYEPKIEGEWFFVPLAGHYEEREFITDIDVSCGVPQCIKVKKETWFVPKDWIKKEEKWVPFCCGSSSSSSSSSSSPSPCNCGWPDKDHCDDNAPSYYTTPCEGEDCWAVCKFSKSDQGWTFVGLFDPETEEDAVTVNCEPSSPSPSYSSCSSSSSSSQSSSSSISSSSSEGDCYCCPPDIDIDSLEEGVAVTTACLQKTEEAECFGECNWVIQSEDGNLFISFSGGDCGVDEERCRKSSSSSSSLSSLSSESSDVNCECGPPPEVNEVGGICPLFLPIVPYNGGGYVRDYFDVTQVYTTACLGDDPNCEGECVYEVICHYFGWDWLGADVNLISADCPPKSSSSSSSSVSSWSSISSVSSWSSVSSSSSSLASSSAFSSGSSETQDCGCGSPATAWCYNCDYQGGYQYYSMDIAEDCIGQPENGMCYGECFYRVHCSCESPQSNPEMVIEVLSSTCYVEEYY